MGFALESLNGDQSILKNQSVMRSMIRLFQTEDTGKCIIVPIVGIFSTFYMLNR